MCYKIIARDIIFKIISSNNTFNIINRIISQKEVSMQTKKTTETKHPITVQDHMEVDQKNRAKKINKVNEVLNIPTGDRFEQDLTELLDSDAEANGESIVIALFDMDKFDHINKDFGRDEGDRVLIEAGTYLKNNIPECATLYRIGGDEYGLIFKGDLEREDVFLILNDLKNNLDIRTPDGEKQTVTIGMAAAFVDASRCTEVVRKADSALYRAKVSGRDKVAMAKEEKMVPKTSHYTHDQLQRLSKLSKREGIGEAILLREAIDMLLKKYDC